MRISDWSSDVCSSDLDALSDGGNRDRIGGRHDRSQCECHGERHGGDQPMDEKAHADDGEHHETESKPQDRLAVLEQFLTWNAPALEEEQWRQEQKEKYLGIARYSPISDQSNAGAQLNLHERPGQIGRAASGQRGVMTERDSGWMEHSQRP